MGAAEANSMPLLIISVLSHDVSTHRLAGSIQPYTTLKVTLGREGDREAMVPPPLMSLSDCHSSIQHSAPHPTDLYGLSL